MLGSLTIHQPATVAEAAKLRAELGDDGAIYAGGSELLLVMKEGIGRWRHLIDVKGIAALRELRDAGDRLDIGATVTHRDLERSPLLRARFPVLADMQAQVANVRVRNVGTLGGNLCFAEPHSDPSTALLVHDARVVLSGPTGARTLPLAEFVVGSYETALRADEVLVRIEVPAPPARAVGAYLKFGFHERPTVGVAALIVPAGDRIAEARVSVGCIGPTPARLAALEARLAGTSVTALAAGIDARDGGFADLDVVSDLHGSAEYKREVAAVLASRALAAAARRVRSAA
ncbi:MAG: FAD binding domain-containing protein [Candidatus Rokubacteria bacterium]|nr:FAD binding domain-containing protein [Candidatus Rokubacteria bacterium]